MTITKSSPLLAKYKKGKVTKKAGKENMTKEQKKKINKSKDSHNTKMKQIWNARRKVKHTNDVAQTNN